ncbi:MAG: CDP-glycerol glycerophosphotransferase family protein [bacterium]|nr:CDP-glycerol glycerophosphotransferase family protein [bacterium]
MKTIFITSFEGVETKNLLRTAILPTLLRDPDVRIMLFAHDQDRAMYHQKEFGNDRISYIVVPKPVIRGLDRLFQKLKFTLLKTKTTDIRRKMKYQLSKNRLWYVSTLLINRLVAHRPGRMIFRFLDYHLISYHDYDSYLDQCQPSAVVLANLFDEPEVHFLRAAKKRGITTIGFINSWDKVTARCILRLLPDKIVVFNPTVKKEVIRYNHAREEDIFVGGMPQYDHYVTRSVISREAFFKKIGMPPTVKLMVYVPIGNVYGDSDWPMIDFLHELNQEGKFGKNVEMLVRFPPNDTVDQKKLAQRPWLRYDHPGLRFSHERGGDWDMGTQDLAHLGDTLAHMSLLIGYASSIAIDAAFFDKPIISINFEVQKNLHPAKSPTTYQHMIHSETLRKPGGMYFVQNKQELVESVRKYLQNPSLDREGRKRLVREQCVFTDGKSGERIGNYILGIAR